MKPLKLATLAGHRGARDHAPENTLAGFRKAAEQGMTWVEYDIRLTADNVAVVHHDDTLGRTVAGDAPVIEVVASDLLAMDAGSHFSADYSGETVPSFSEVIALCRELGLAMNVEIKDCPGHQAPLVARMIEDLRSGWELDQGDLVISSFDVTSLEECHKQALDLPLGYLLDEFEPGWEATAERLNCVSIHANDEMIRSESDMKRITDLGYAALIFTVNDRARAEQLLSWGAATIITDDPPAMAGL